MVGEARGEEGRGGERRGGQGRARRSLPHDESVSRVRSEL